MLRQSVLRDYVTLAGAGPGRHGTLARADAARGRAGQHQPGRGHRSRRWDIVARPVAAGQPVTWAQYLDASARRRGSPFARLADLRASLDRLAVLPTAELDRLLTETLDACSHRLDVWVTAIANALLASAARRGPAKPAQPTPAPRRRTAGWRTCARPPRRAPVTGADAAAVSRLDASRAQARCRRAARRSRAGAAARRTTAGSCTRRR